jgi:sugar-specific transcriptional regulator TrmB
LESLRRKGFATATPASPPAYSPVSPAEVLGPYYETEKKSIQNRASKVQEEAQARLETVREAYLTLVRDYPRTGGASRNPPDRVWVLQERENIEKTLIELIKDAKSNVLRITKPPDPESRQPVDPFYIVGMDNLRFVYDAVERKVEMRWLSLAREIPTFLGLDIAEPPERRYLERDQDITEKFLLVDNHSVLLNLHDPMSPAYGFVALAMQSRAVSSIFLDHFEKMWKKGKPLGAILPKMRELVDVVCTDLRELGMNRIDVSLYRTLSRSGAITRDLLEQEMMKKKVQPRDTSAACDRLMRLGLVHRETAFKVLMVEHPSNVKASIAKGELKFGRGEVITTRRPPSGKNP